MPKGTIENSAHNGEASAQRNTPGAGETVGEPLLGEQAQPFLQMLATDYGIRYIGNRQYEIDRGEVTYQGTLDFVFEVYSGVSKPGGSE